MDAKLTKSSASAGKQRFMVLSGFLGAGKTTTMIALSESLAACGKKAGIISNDLGTADLVDALYTERSGCCSAAIAGDCICYVTETLVDRIKRFTDVDGADIVMSDIPGCGVGALDHVYFRLHQDYNEDFELAPFTVVCDPVRLRAIMPEQESINLPEEMNYLFRTQLLEADAIVLNKIDTISAGERERCVDFLKTAYPGVPVFPVSAMVGTGIAALREHIMTGSARLVDVDTGYGGAEFAAAEAALCWYDSRFFVEKEAAFDGSAFARDYIETVRAALIRAGGNVPHLKVFVTGEGGDFAKASLTGVDYETQFDRQLDAQYEKYSVVVNARAACPSKTLDRLMKNTLDAVIGEYSLDCQVLSIECFGMMDEKR